MTPSYVKVTDLRVGLPVEYLGKSDPVPVLDEKLQAIGMVLYSGHPGRIWSTLVQHVQVTWASLQDEPATYAVGFSVPDDDETHYPGLGLLTEDEFSRRERALQDRLASGGKPVRLGSTMVPRRLTAMISRTPSACSDLREVSRAAPCRRLHV